MSLLKQLEIVKVHITTVESNLEDLENKGRKASAPKARKSIQECRKLLFDLRKDIMTHVKSIPVKPRVVKVVSKPEKEEVDVSKVDVSKPEEIVLEPVMKKPILKNSTNPPVIFFKPIVRNPLKK